MLFFNLLNIELCGSSLKNVQKRRFICLQELLFAPWLPSLHFQHNPFTNCIEIPVRIKGCFIFFNRILTDCNNGTWKREKCTLRARWEIIDFLICSNVKEKKWHAQQCLEHSQVDATWFVAYLWLFLPYVYWIIPPLHQHVPFSSVLSRKTHICVVSNTFRPDQRECV